MSATRENVFWVLEIDAFAWSYLDQLFQLRSYVDAVVEAIADSAASGRIGDGKIFVHTLDQAIRIRTGEEGEKAL